MRIIIPFLAAVFIGPFCIPKLFGQDYSWKNYSVAEGLPQTQVLKIMQDSDGLLWLATKSGISIFDGIEFENYSTKDGLDFDHVGVIQEFKKGVVYIGTVGGLNVMIDREIATLVKDLPDDINFMHADQQENLWFYNIENGLFVYDNGQIQKTHPVFDALEEGELLFSNLTRKSDGKLIFGSNKGNVYLPNHNGYERVTVDAGNPVEIREGADGNLYANMFESLYLYEKGSFRPIFKMGMEYTLLLVNNANDIYLSNYGYSGTLYHYLNGKIDKLSDKFNLISTVLKDDEGNIWLGTDSGLWMFQGQAFQNYLKQAEDNDYAWSVLQDKNGDFLFGSYNHRLKKSKDGSFIEIPYRHLDKQNPVSFYSGGIKTNSGDLLITNSIGVFSYDGATLDWFYKPAPPSTVVYIYDDRKYQKYLLSSNAEGLVEVDSKGNFKVYNGRQPWEHTELITSILRDKFDRIWISGKKGISIWEDDRWRHLPDEKDSIPIGAISMLLDSAQNIWLGSNDGLYYYDYSRLQRIAGDVFTMQIGVLNTTNKNELLVGTINGLGIIDLNDFYRTGETDVRFFDHNTGFVGVECKHNSSFKDDDGNIWICTSNCVVKVNPEELKTNPKPPRVYIRSINSSSGFMEWEHSERISSTSSPPVFDAKHDDLRINYHGISLSAPNGVKYRTMLEGYDTDWSAMTKERYRTYTNLPHKTYTFKVKACNFDGVWTSDAVEVTFRILPAWHELMSVKITGIALITIFAIGIGYIFSERNRRKRLKEEQAEKNIAKLQFKSLKGMIDPHFTFNAINSIASMVYSEKKDEAYGYFTKFSRLIRNVFEHSEKTTRTLEEEMDFVTNYLDIEKMRFGDKFDYVVTLDPGLNLHMEIPKLLIQIYVENAIKHGLMGKESGGKLEIEISDQNNQIEIIIRDNGVGRANAKKIKPSSEGLGKGTAIIQQYFDLLNKFNEGKIVAKTIDRTDASGTPAGTEVHITIPIDFKYSL